MKNEKKKKQCFVTLSFFSSATSESLLCAIRVERKRKRKCLFLSFFLSALPLSSLSLYRSDICRNGSRALRKRRGRAGEVRRESIANVNRLAIGFFDNKSIVSFSPFSPLFLASSSSSPLNKTPKDSFWALSVPSKAQKQQQLKKKE